MSNTQRFGMPLVQSAQAQKHVTVNESLMRLDGLVNLVLQSVTTTQPPAAVIDGQCWGVPGGASGTWSGEAGRIAIGSNGGWVFVTPTAGMSAFVADQGTQAFHSGTQWIVGAASMGRQGSGMIIGMAEKEVQLSSGASFDTGVTIPANAMVIGAVAKVSVALTGTVTTWKLGTAGAENRFGQGIGKAKNSWARGMLGSPMTYYQNANLMMTAESGQFTGGKVKLAVHWWEVRLPD